MSMPNHQRGISLVSIVVILLIMAAAFLYFSKESGNGLTHTGSPAELSGDHNGLYVLAGSELKDIEPFFSDIKKATGVTLGLEYTGTLDGVDLIAAGKQVDAAWFSHGKYLSLIDRSKIKSQAQTMLSPVVMGIKASKAESLGWLDANSNAKSDLTWADIAREAGAGNLHFAMTNPASSNSGFTALMGVTAALAGTSDAPTAADIVKARAQLKDFFKGQKLTSGSSGWLADAYVNAQTKAGNTIDGMINYESVLMQLNASGKLSEPLVLLYPSEGIVTADYPLMLINNDKRANFDKVVDYLKSADFQAKVMAQTDRRPVNTQVALEPKFYNKLMVELPFPGSAALVDDILFSYLNELRIPAHAVFVLDTSGSMRGEGIGQLKAAMLGLAGGDTSRTGRFAKFSNREQITIIPFSGGVQSPLSFTLSETNKDMAELKAAVSGLNAKGGTAIYDALEVAYRYLADVQKKDIEQGIERYYTVVLMSDGSNTKGKPLSAFEGVYAQMPPSAQQIKTFAVLFGGADENEMRRVTELTGGRVFDGRSGELSQVFKKIRGYQ